MSTSDIQLYAELLVNIRHVSISVTLPTPADDLTVAELLPQQSGINGHARFRVQHHDAVREMTLPGRVAMPDRAVRFPLSIAAKKTNFTWRLPVVDTPARGSSDDDELAPWSAPDLQPGSSVSCRGCHSEIIPCGRIGVWKDLPSDNWAEMMEFWHCHKPEHKHHGKDEESKQNTEKATGDALAGRGYGANSAILAEAGVGFVDLITLMFAEIDCEGLKFSESTFEHAADKSIMSASTKDADNGAGDIDKDKDVRGLNVYCAACHAQVGYYSLRMQSVNVFKWQVDCQSTSSSDSAESAPTVSDCVAATLVATIARTGSSKSVILPIYEVDNSREGDSRDSMDKILHIWVLNSSICYASSTTEPRRALKLLFKYIGRPEADDLVVKLNSDVQEINLPIDTITTVARQLEASNGLLPVNDRVFKEWKIGLIERWR